ncbi:MAG: peptidoglycan-binding domain-containing protein [Acetobacteraceae bacterium]
MKLHAMGLVLAFGAAAAASGCATKPAKTAAPATPPKEVAVPAAPMPPPSNPAANEASHSLVRQVQHILAKDHLYTIRIDGIWGPRTESGARQYQAAHGLAVTGQLDWATLHAMNLHPAG